MKRRNLIKLIASSASLSAFSATMPSSSVAMEAPATGQFHHGVASGDPLADSVILWTRVSPTTDGSSKSLRWEISLDDNFESVVAGGTFIATTERDFTVKIDAGNLSPDTSYYYRFKTQGVSSPTGRTRTLALGHLESARFAVVACSNHPAGYFNVYREIARRPYLNAVIHLGDYIYEYGMGGYATDHAAALGRKPVPGHEIVSLTDYRQRHGHYKQDADLQALHATHPIICVWDDHETSNNAWQSGSPRDGEGPQWSQRKSNALKAYYEWMPIRELDDSGINRRFDFGDLASLIMLDTRLKGREKQPEANKYALGFQRGRQMLGKWQESWLENQLKDSTAQRWTLIGQQVMVSPLLQPDLRSIADPQARSVFAMSGGQETYERAIDSTKYGLPLLLDAWDGYPKAREKFLGLLGQHARNLIVLTGDIHTGICSELFLADGKTCVGKELITPAVTSPGLDAYFPSIEPGKVTRSFLEKNPHLEYFNGRDKGWIEVALSHAEAVSYWNTVNTITSKDYEVSIAYQTSIAANA